MYVLTMTMVTLYVEECQLVLKINLEHAVIFITKHLNTECSMDIICKNYNKLSLIDKLYI